MDHFKPHLSPRPRFEGYYSNFTLPDQSRVIIVISSVPRARVRPHLVAFVYIPCRFPREEAVQRELYVEEIEMVDFGGRDGKGFELRVPDVGRVVVREDGESVYELRDPGGGWVIEAIVGGEGRVAWAGEGKGAEGATPEGWLVNLPLPLHWHVQSLASRCRVRLWVEALGYVGSVRDGDRNEADSEDVGPGDGQSGPGDGWIKDVFVHQEKNWAYSFPSSHIWIQARRRHGADRTGICLAGGSILDTQSYLITYHARDPYNDVSFAPPLASALSIPLPSALISIFRLKSSRDHEQPFNLTLSPTLSTDISWPERTAQITVTTSWTRLEISAVAPEGTFVGISAPFHDGHRENFVAQSFRACVTVRLFRADRGGLGHWVLVEENSFEGGEAGLEFGGGVYGDRGSGDEG